MWQIRQYKIESIYIPLAYSIPNISIASLQTSHQCTSVTRIRDVAQYKKIGKSSSSVTNYNVVYKESFASDNAVNHENLCQK